MLGSVAVEVCPRNTISFNRLEISRPNRKQALLSPSQADSRQVTVADLSSALVRVAETKDHGAFRQLFDHYAPRIKSYLMRQGANAREAEDLAQEVMMAVWRKADKYVVSKASAGTWIFTIARNLRIDAFRRENRPEFDPNDPAFVPAPEQMPDRALEVSKIQKTIRCALKELPEEQATVIRMSFFEDKAHRHIADELNLPLGTVKSRLRLGMARIRASLGEAQ